MIQEKTLSSREVLKLALEQFDRANEQQERADNLLAENERILSVIPGYMLSRDAALLSARKWHYTAHVAILASVLLTVALVVMHG